MGFSSRLVEKGIFVAQGNQAAPYFLGFCRSGSTLVRPKTTQNLALGTAFNQFGSFGAFCEKLGRQGIQGNKNLGFGKIYDIGPAGSQTDGKEKDPGKFAFHGGRSLNPGNIKIKCLS